MSARLCGWRSMRGLWERQRKLWRRRRPRFLPADAQAVGQEPLHLRVGGCPEIEAAQLAVDVARDCRGADLHEPRHPNLRIRLRVGQLPHLRTRGGGRGGVSE